MTGLAELRRKIAAGKRIISGRSDIPCSDPIVEAMIVAELRNRIPELERRVRQLEGFEGDANRRVG